MKKYLFLFSIIVLNSSCEDIVEVEDISSKTVSILAPVDDALINDANIIFSWEALAEADNYTIQIAKPTFEQATQILTDTTVTTTSFLKVLEPNDYEWRIRASNSEYNTLFITRKLTIN